MVSISDVLMPGMALLATVVLIRLLRRPAAHLGLTDQPSHRKHHQGTVPLIGGIAMMAIFCLSLLGAAPLDHARLGLILALVVLTTVGAVDDARDLSTRSRFIAQMIACGLMMVVGDTLLINLGNLMGTGDIFLGPLGIPFTVFCVVGTINALNMLDGMDGLAGGVTLVATGWLAVVVGLSGSTAALSLLVLLAAVILGFLCFNLRHPWRARASVFMGDAGSMGLGFIMAWLLISLSQGDQSALSPITAVWILGLPLMDTVSIMIRRALRGVSPFTADRQHLHHLLQRLGCSDGQTTILLMLAALGLGAVGVSGELLGVAEYWMHLGFWVVFLVYHWGMGKLWQQLDTEPMATPTNPTIPAPPRPYHGRLSNLSSGWPGLPWSRARRRKRPLVDSSSLP